MELTANFLACVASAPLELTESNGTRVAFQWGGTIFALFLLLLNRIEQRSSVQTNLLTLYLFASLPTALFKILRGEFGCWVNFPAIAANIFFPETFPVSRFVLFVVTPDWVANGLRGGTVAGVLCFIIGILLVVSKIQ